MLAIFDRSNTGLSVNRGSEGRVCLVTIGTVNESMFVGRSPQARDYIVALALSDTSASRTTNQRLGFDDIICYRL